MFSSDLFDVYSKPKEDAIQKAAAESKTEGASAKRRRTSLASDGPSPKKVKKPSSDAKDTKVSAVAAEIASAMPVVKEQPVSEMLAETFKQPGVTVKHETAYPPDYQPLPPRTPPEKPARSYPFTLDPFQQKSVECLEKEESVMVSAHTSAGKTVVAEYAIAMALRDKQRVIYTSPIKALSNQKYRDLLEEFQDVGLMTGDVTINPSASCLVMTTEILRSMLYRGSEIMREVAWVIFDEIHYMRDKERGVVWEETIILLPDSVHYVFLSATIPNAKEFAGWIAKVHTQPVHVVYTDYRPTPLQHYIFPGGGDGLYLVVDEKGDFREDNFQKAITLLKPPGENDKKKKFNKKKKKGDSSSDIFKIVRMIMERGYDPVIIFSFSKRDCEDLAMQLTQLDFNGEDEKTMVDAVFNNAIDSLAEEDRKLPQIESILPLLRRGIGIHHSGLLPILKEIIEILFQEGLIKALFATETFSMGLNMPAKTVVFTSVKKFDGTTFRWVSGGEYIQMSGRAGRRGLDDRGIVILMVDEKMEPAVCKSMLKGHSDPLNSSFHVGYNMLLNLLRLEDADPEYMLLRSFHQFQNERAVPELEERIKVLTDEKDSLKVEDEDMVANYYHLKHQLEKLKEEMRAVMNHHQYALPYLQPGRLAKVRDGDDDFGWGVVVNFSKKHAESKATPSVTGETVRYIVDILLHCAPSEGKRQRPRPFSQWQKEKLASEDPKEVQEAKEAKGEMHVVPVLLPLLDGLSTLRVYIHKDLRPVENRQAVLMSVKEVMKRFPDGPPLLDPIEDMNITSSEFTALLKKVELLDTRLVNNPLFKSPELAERYAVYHRKMSLEHQVKELKKQIRESTHMFLKEQMKSMRRVLRRLGYVSSDNVIELKGRVAAEINAADELLITDMMFDGVFNPLTPEQTVALLSVFVFQEKSEENVKLKEVLGAPLRQMQESARRIGKIKLDCKLPIDVEEYVESFKPHLMDVAHAWANGSKFADVCEMTDVFEGSIIRCLRRLEELLRQMASAAKAIGNTELENKFSESITKIKRDIVFAASLYL